MNLSAAYERQFSFRPWAQILQLLPELAGQVVADLGCGIGAQAAELSARGARVLGLDGNADLLAAARARSIANAEFFKVDLNSSLGIEGLVDGIWCSFAAAYFPMLGPRLEMWKEHLRPGGWIALTEVDDLFGHEPLHADTKALLAAYADDALSTGRYDFHMGHKLGSHLKSAGFTVQKAVTLADKELSFAGPAEPEVLALWNDRMNRLASLQQFCGLSFTRVRDDFLAALTNSTHRSTATVHCCYAIAT